MNRMSALMFTSIASKSRLSRISRLCSGGASTISKAAEISTDHNTNSRFGQRCSQKRSTNITQHPENIISMTMTIDW